MILEQHAKTCMMQLSISINRTFISWNVCNRNTKGIIINDLSLHFKKLEKEQQESTGWQKITEIRADINDAENQWRKLVKPKDGSLKRQNLDKPLARKTWENTDHHHQK